MLVKNFMRAALLAATLAGVAHAQQGADMLPPIPLSMLEQQGTLTRVDIARSLVWIDGRSYRLDPGPATYVGSERLKDLRSLVVGSRVGFMDDGQGNLTTFWSAASSEKPESRGDRPGARR